MTFSNDPGHDETGSLTKDAGSVPLPSPPLLSTISHQVHMPDLLNVLTE